MRAVELFAGAGGAAVGLHRAGFSHDLLVERDPQAAATLQAARLGRVVCADVRDVDYRSHVGIDLLWASPPCQAWSTAGNRSGATDTDRNGWPWVWTIVDEADPSWLVCENVPGLLQHSSEHHPDPLRCRGCYLETVILAEARARFAWVDVWRLNAADYGVPQTRSRIFLICGDHRIARPAPTHGDPRTLSPLFDQRKPWRTMGDALLIAGQCLRPSPSICAVVSQGLGGSYARDQCEKMIGRRFVTAREAALIQSFPADHPFDWTGSVSALYTQIGNAVPPPVSEAIGRAIIAGAEIR